MDDSEMSHDAIMERYYNPRPYLNPQPTPKGGITIDDSPPTYGGPALRITRT